MRIATFNILHGRSTEDDRVDVDRLAAAVERLDADVLGLQEVDRDQPRSFGADLTAVAAEAMGAKEHQFVAALTGTPGGTWMAATGEEQPGSATYGIALLSRYPVVSWRVVRLPPLRASVPLWSTWTNRPFLARDEPRVAVAAVLDGPFGEFTVCNTHLSFIPAWNALQLRRLVRSLTGTREPLVVIAACRSPTAMVVSWKVASARATEASTVFTSATLPRARLSTTSPTRTGGA